MKRHKKQLPRLTKRVPESAHVTPVKVDINDSDDEVIILDSSSIPGVCKQCLLNTIIALLTFHFTIAENGKKGHPIDLASRPNHSTIDLHASDKLESTCDTVAAPIQTDKSSTSEYDINRFVLLFLIASFCSN